MSNAPLPTDPLLATDEHIAVYAMADYKVLCPPDSILASGIDGAFSRSSPWVLTSASVDFEAQGVAPQNVVIIDGPRNPFRGGGHRFAVDAVSGNAATLRRVGYGAGVGQPPALAGDISAVAFSVPSLRPQIDLVSYRIKERFSIDEAAPFRATAWAYSGVEDDDPAPRVFRDAAVYTTLAELYQNALREQSENGDFARKAKLYRELAREALDRLQIRWGPTGSSNEPTSIFSCKLTR